MVTVRVAESHCTESAPNCSAAQRKGTITWPSITSISAGTSTTEPFICIVNGGADRLFTFPSVWAKTPGFTVKSINTTTIPDIKSLFIITLPSSIICSRGLGDYFC